MLRADGTVGIHCVPCPSVQTESFVCMEHGHVNSAPLLQETLEKLKSSQHELAAIQRQRDGLARQLALVADKIGSGVIPDPADLTVPEHIAAAAGASASASAVRAPPARLGSHQLRCAALLSACCARHALMLQSFDPAAGLLY